jgi:hypothetical protein
MAESIQFKYVILISTIIIIIINLTFGTYYLGYERLFNSFFLQEFVTRLGYNNNYNVWFLTAPIISYLNSKFIYSYNIIYTCVVLLNLSVIIYNTCILLNINKRTQQLFASIIISIIFVNLMIELSNRQIIIWVVFNILFTIYNIQQSKQYKKILIRLVYILIPICITLRFEIALILFSISAFFSIIFQQKLILKYSLFFLSICVFIFLFYHVLQNTIYKEYYYIEKAEHEIIDRNSVNPISTNIVEELKLKAYKYYITDTEYLDKKYYRNLFYKNDFINSKITTKYFYYVIGKIKSFYTELLSDRQFIIYFIFSIILILFITKLKYKLLSIVFIILIIPSFFNILLNFETDLTITMFLFLLISLLVYCYNYFTFNSIQFKIISIILGLFMANNILNMYFTKQHYENHDKKILNYCKNILEYGKKNNKAIVYANIDGEFESYPSKLFSIKKSDIIPHYYLNMFFYVNYDYYKNHNRKFFTNIDSYKDRIKDIISKDAIFLSNDFLNKFIIEYMFYIHGMNIKINAIKLKNITVEPNTYFSTYKIYYSNDKK